MKFIARKGAPDIPMELIEAQEEGNLVFFCGAGISYEANLPGFADLVSKVYKNIGEQMTEIEKEAIRAGFYDRALGLLEARIIGKGLPEINLVRRAIIEELTFDDNANLENHKAILRLSKTKNKKYRLVTTNVDHGFKKADPFVSSMIDSAPKLPVPKPYKWESVVHLHGIINNDDPNGEQLIFTSGDFGAAYLTERWASKFVTELFNHFTILFVGYSVNDPVIRYMTDAIAAERLRDYKVLRKPFVIAYTTPSKRHDNENTWRAKGIEPILYEYSHKNLYNTLKEWGNYVRDGLNAKERIVKKEARIAPLPPYDQDSSITRLIDVLYEKTRHSSEQVTGYPAKIFSKLKNPPAPIEWLPVLYEKELLTLSQSEESVLPVSPFPSMNNVVKPNKISKHLWRWLLHHLENDALLTWVIDKGLCLHPYLKDIIKDKLRDDPPQEPYLKFWKIATSNYLECGKKIADEGYYHIRTLHRDIDHLSLSELSNFLEPLFKVSKSMTYYELNKEENNPDIQRKKPYQAEVVIGLSDWEFEKLSEMKAYPNGLIDLLFPATQALLKALNFWNFVDLSDEWHDHSYWDMPSISANKQNKRHRSWIILIELCRDLWVATWDNDKEKAVPIFQLWRKLKYPVFRRLSFHAMTVRDVESPEMAINYLLEDNGWWLWSAATRREVFRMLAKFWSELDEQTTNCLITNILKGPPRSMFFSELTEEEWKISFDRSIWLMLSKLESFGKPLPAIASTALEGLRARYPSWSLQQDERDEFTFWMEFREGPDVDMTVDELFEKEISEIVDNLSKDTQRYTEGRVNLFREGCRKEYRDKGIQVLSYLAASGNWSKTIWHAGLVGLANNEKSTWNEIGPLLKEAEPVLYQEEPWAIAYWSKENASKIKCNAPEEHYFWFVFNSLLNNCSYEKNLNQIRDPINWAINNPIGIITEALIDRIVTCKLEAGEGIPDGPLKENLNSIILSDTIPSYAGKIILASRLHYFFLLDPRWTKKNLIPLFDWGSSQYACLMWEGYLWSPRISADLAIALKNHLVTALKHSDQTAESIERLIQLFALVCLQYPELYKAKEQQDILIDIGPEGVAHITELFWSSIKEDASSADNYWRYRIQPFMKKAWPKEARFITPKTSKNLSLSAIELDEAFEEALEFLLPFIKPFQDLSAFLIHLAHKELPDKKPKTTFKLLSVVFSEEYQWPFDTFRDILNRIVKAEPSIVNEPSYSKMNDYLIQHDL